jgi:hypothetical protein
MRARRHPTVYSNGHQDLRGEPLRKSVSDGVAEARALLKGTTQRTRSKDQVDAVIDRWLPRS